MAISQLKHWIRSTTDARYRELQRILGLPPSTPGRTNLLGPTLDFVDGRSFYLQHKVIFEDEIYALDADGPSPVIIDGGANIGMATTYLKRRFPGATITAVEADPRIAGVLRGNVESFGFSGVKVVHAALSPGKEPVVFYSNPREAEGGRAGHPSDGYLVKTVVEPLDLRDLLEGPVDLLKLDIEGAEADVLFHASDRLDRVKNLFVEYHSFADQEQKLPELLAMLKEKGFRVHIQTDYCSPRPLLERIPSSSMDLRLNLFGVRDRPRA